MKRYGKYYWKDLLKEYKEQTTNTYRVFPGSKPHPSEAGHEGVIADCEEEE